MSDMRKYGVIYRVIDHDHVLDCPLSKSKSNKNRMMLSKCKKCKFRSKSYNSSCFFIRCLCDKDLLDDIFLDDLLALLHKTYD